MEEEKKVLRRMDDERMAKLEERVANWMATTTEYRVLLCTKIDKIFERLNALPCKESAEEKKGMKGDIGWLQKILWTAIIMIVPALISLAVAWGAINVTVATNAGIIQDLDSRADLNEKDIVELKARVCGYKGASVAMEQSLGKKGG